MFFMFFLHCRYSNGTLSPAFYANITISGSSICGTVPAFQNASFIPIARNTEPAVAATVSITSYTQNVSSSTTSKIVSAASLRPEIFFNLLIVVLFFNI